MKFYTNVVRYGNNLLVREVNNGERSKYPIKYSPTMYTRVSKPTSHKSLDGRFVTPVKHETMKECTEWLQSYENQKHLIFGNTLHAYSYIADTYPNTVNWDIDKILIITMDIEVQCENGFPNPRDAAEPLLSITIKNHQNKRIMVWGIGEFKNNRDDVDYVECEDEKDLIQQFLSFWEKALPDVITGWNTEFFDIPYLHNRIIKLYDDKEVKRLSPWGHVYSKEVYMMGRNHQVIDIQGISALDYFDLYRKFTYTSQEKYTLDHIAYVELGERKDGNPYDTFSEWYQKDYQSFIEYNITDVELVDKLEDKMKLIELALTMAYDAKTNYMDVLGTTKYWDIIIYNYLRKKNIVIPQRISSSKTEKFEGAYVKDPIVGMHKWVMSFDLNSLYPHLIMQYNISTETLVSQNKVSDMSVDKLLNKEFDTSKLDKNHTMTPNGAIFRTDKKGFLPQLMEDMYNTRTEYKRKMLEAKQEYENTKDKKLLKDISKYNNIQMAKKISLNSAYGAIGNAYFRYYNLLIAEAITLGGQLSIRWIESALNRYLNKTLDTTNEDFVVASDTDSVYITFDRLVNKVFKSQSDVGKITDFLDTVAKEKIEPFIDKSYKDLSEYLNCHSQRMNMKREVIADKAIWTAKKRYILNAWDIEGVRYKEPNLKMMGIEAVKSSTPAPCRQKIKEALKIIMSDDEKMLNTFIQDFHEEFMNLSPEDIGFPRSVNNVGNYTNKVGSNVFNMDTGKVESKMKNLFAKRAPLHTKGAILYNYLISELKLENKYPTIQEGDKIKFVYLKEPNSFLSSSISFVTKFPKEFDGKFSIDVQKQFDKSFIEPLVFITDKLKWNIKNKEEIGTLEDFF